MLWNCTEERLHNGAEGMWADGNPVGMSPVGGVSVALTPPAFQNVLACQTTECTAMQLQNASRRGVTGIPRLQEEQN